MTIFLNSRRHSIKNSNYYYLWSHFHISLRYKTSYTPKRKATEKNMKSKHSLWAKNELEIPNLSVWLGDIESMFFLKKLSHSE